jgi:hypothetical protein
MSAMERVQFEVAQAASVARRAAMTEGVAFGGLYAAHYWMPIPPRLDELVALREELARLTRGRLSHEAIVRIERIRDLIKQIPHELVWQDRFLNVVTTEGKNAALTHILKGSAYTASQALGLIEDLAYSAVAAGNTAANITTGSGSPANGWNEAPAATCAARQTPSFGTASGGSLGTSSATAHATLATDTIKGAFLLCRSVAGVAPTTTVGNTSGALLSAGVFSGGDQPVSNGGTLNVTYTLSA